MKQNGNIKNSSEKLIKWINEEKITSQQSPQIPNPQTCDSSLECLRNRGQPALTACVILWEDPPMRREPYSVRCFGKRCLFPVASLFNSRRLVDILYADSPCNCHDDNLNNSYK
jgi:hypothetical protein